MADVQHRLAALGWNTAPDPESTFGAGTRAGLEAFQHARGLRIDGICGVQTWGALVEASFRLGDRLLYLRRPMLRGDDVADLQRQLSALGFHSGRVDGIFGELTADAVAEFQRNMGLRPDGICGNRTIREIHRVMPRVAEPELVTAVRDREQLRHAPRTLLARKVAIGEEGGLGVLVAAICRRLDSVGAEGLPILHSDGSLQASVANAAGVEVYLGLRLNPQRAACITAYYAGYQVESPGGRRLAELVQDAVARALGVPGDGPRGMSLPVLRETRMPAIICEIGPAGVVVERSAALAEALVDALAAWVTTPVD